MEEVDEPGGSLQSRAHTPVHAHADPAQRRTRTPSRIAPIQRYHRDDVGGRAVLVFRVVEEVMYEGNARAPSRYTIAYVGTDM